MIPRKWAHAIKQQRKGKLSYKAKLPHWQGAVRTMKDQREICQQQTKAGADEYRLRRMLMRARQNNLCCLCGLWMSEEECSFEHENGRGGGKREDRILIDGKRVNGASHCRCNMERGSRRTPFILQ